MVNGRPRKTQDELDQEMEDYWGDQKKVEPAINGAVQNGNTNGLDSGATAAAPEVAMDDEDIDMIE